MGRNCEISIRVAVNTQRGFTVTAQALRLGAQLKQRVFRSGSRTGTG